VTHVAEQETRATILVVDDEVGYCEKIARYLSGLGYEVLTATNARDAILLAGVHHPTVLITDWMLCDKVHGLHVIDTVRTVYPTTRAVVMTGFASGDLRMEARTRDVCAFVEKPFTPERLALAVEEVVAMSSPRPPYPSFAFVRTDATGAVIHVNEEAIALLGLSADEARGRPIRSLFGSLQPLIVDHAVMRWIHGLHPTSRPDARCVARARRLIDGGYFVLLSEDKDASMLEYHMSAHLLLDLADGLPSPWTAAGHGIVIDPDIGARTLVGCVFEEMASICHAAESYERGLELLELDSDVRYVVVDPAVPGDLADFVRRARKLRPDVLVLGHADRAQLSAFAGAGLDKSIAKPWQVSAFVDLLIDHR